MKIQENYNLAKLNTLGIQAYAKFFVEVKEDEELKELFTDPIFIENKKFFFTSSFIPSDSRKAALATFTTTATKASFPTAPTRVWSS